MHNLPSSSRSDWGIRILFLLLVAGITGFFLWQVSPEVLQGQLDGPDAYMRLVRVTRLVETGGWYDSAIPRSNAPFGETLHWTRPLDVLLLVGATLLRPFFSFPHALFWAGVFLSPVLLLFIGNLAAWASEPLAGREYRHLATIAVLTQVGVLQTTLPGRPDHHALHLLIFFLTLGAALRWVMEPFSARTSFLAGSWVGMGLWVGTEFLVPLGLLLGCGLFFWIRDGGEHAEKNRWFSLGLAAVLLLALLLEQPLSRLLVAELDKISIPHATLGILAVLFWTLLGKGFGNPQGMSQRRSRLLSALAAGLVATGLFYAVFPSFFHGPEAGIHPRLAPLWRTHVGEDQPLISSLDMSALGDLLLFLGQVFLVAPFLAWVLTNEKHPQIRDAYLLLSILLIAFLALALFRFRFLAYPGAILAIATVCLIARFLPAARAVQNRMLRPILIWGLVLGAFFAPQVVGISLMVATEADKPGATVEEELACPITPMVELLAKPEYSGNTPATIAAHLDYGPEILYRTSHRVVATPYHRNADGILSLFSMFGNADLEAARRSMDDRGVDLLLICPLYSWLYPGGSDGSPAPPSLYQALSAGRAPEWLEEIPLPPDSAGDFLLFRRKE